MIFVNLVAVCVLACIIYHINFIWLIVLEYMLVLMVLVAVVAVIVGVFYCINRIKREGKEEYYYDGNDPPGNSCPGLINLNCHWMKNVPYNTPLSKLSMPGTHDTMTYDKPSLCHCQWPFIQCQTWTLRSQLDAGIRFIDVRFQVVNNIMILYHSTYDLEGKNMKDNVMKCLASFLKKNPSEVIIMRMKDETMFNRNKSKDAWDQFLQNWENLLWKPDGGIPVYGRELKGKVIVLSELYKTSTTDEYSIPWSSDLLSKIDEFWMQISSYEKKFQNIVSNVENNDSKLMINFLSGTSLTHRPRTIAVEMNKKCYKYAQSSAVTCLGGVIMDYPGMGLIDAIIARNRHKVFSEQAVADNRKSDEEFAELERKQREGKLHSEYLQDVSSALKSDYGKRYKKIPFIPWDETSHIPIDDIYVPLTLQESKDKQWKQVTGEPFKNINEMIQKYAQKDDREMPVRIIIQGNPGCGKSTLCYKLAYDWTKSGKLADRYKLVLLLKARDFKPYQDLFKAITDTIPRKYYEKENSEKFRHILKNGKILLMIDGYDELGDKKDQKDLKDHLDNKLYENFNLVITTRRSCTDHLKKYNSFDQIVTITAFDEEDTTLYVSYYFEYTFGNKDAVKNFMREVKKNNLKNLLKEPLTCLFLCYVWEDSKKLPEIRAQIYDHVLQAMIKTYKRKVGDEFKDKTFNILLNSLSKLAFEKLVEEEGILQFEKTNLEEIYEIDVELACAIGILVKADPPADGKIRLNVCNYYTFPHLTFQEFLAARYLYYSEEFDKNFEAMNLSEHHRYSLVFELLCGHLSIDNDVTDDKLNRLNQMTYLLNQNNLYYEAKNTRVCTSFGSNLTAHWKATGYHNRYKWAVINYDVIKNFHMHRTNKEDQLCMDKVHIFNYSELDQYVLQLDWLEKLAKISTLKILCLERCNCKSDLGSGLEKLFSVNKDLERIIIIGCDLTSHHAMTMVPCLVNLSALSELNLSENPLRESVLHILPNLSRSIESIFMLGCEISSDHAKKMAPMLQRFTMLKNISLACNPLQKSIVDIIGNLCQSIESIVILRCEISSDHAKMMAPKLKRLTLLKRFNLEKNPLGSSAVDITENLQPSIRKLVMQQCDLSADNITSMAPHLKRLTGLEILKVRCNVEKEDFECIRECINEHNSNVCVALEDAREVILDD